MHAGRGNFAIHGAPNELNVVLGRDAALFYFLDVNVAKTFVERLAARACRGSNSRASHR